MDKLTPQLNDVQIRQNIDALKKQGLATDQIQSYVNNYTKSSNGTYVLKNQPAPVETVAEPKTPLVGTLATPFMEGVGGLKELYGGGEKGIARKLGKNVTEGADQLNKGVGQLKEGNILEGAANTAGSLINTGFRTAGDVAGTIFAPVGAAIGSTGINKLVEKGVETITSGEDPVFEAVTNNPQYQAFANYLNKLDPQYAEDFGRAMSLFFASKNKQKIEPSTVVPRTISQVKGAVNTLENTLGNLRPTESSIQAERSAKFAEGMKDQNTHLQKAQKAYEKNTITRTNPDGTKTKINPIETLTKEKIAPVVENGTIKMGDYQTGTGELGKIKVRVGDIDSSIDSLLKDTGKSYSVKYLREQAVKAAKANSDFKAEGSVNANVAKVNAKFDDFEASYGKNISSSDLNTIRKVQNRDFKLETQDSSRLIGDVARQELYKSTPDLKVKSLLQQQGELLAAKKYVEAINNTKVPGGKLGTMALRATGSVIGSGIQQAPVIGPIVGAIGGNYVSKGLQQMQFKSPWTEFKSLFAKPDPQSNILPTNQTAKMMESNVNTQPTIPQVKGSAAVMDKPAAGTINYINNLNTNIANKDMIASDIYSNIPKNLKVAKIASMPNKILTVDAAKQLIDDAARQSPPALAGQIRNIAVENLTTEKLIESIQNILTKK